MTRLLIRDAERAKRMDRLDRMAGLLDSRFSIFGIPVGWDAILGLLPGVGALATAVPGAVMIAEGARMGARKRVLAKMAANTGFDMLIGAVPVLGDVLDLFFKSHRRNVALLKVEAVRLDIEDDVQRSENHAQENMATIAR